MLALPSCECTVTPEFHWLHLHCGTLLLPTRQSTPTGCILSAAWRSTARQLEWPDQAVPTVVTESRDCNYNYFVINTSTNRQTFSVPNQKMRRMDLLGILCLYQVFYSENWVSHSICSVLSSAQLMRYALAFSKNRSLANLLQKGLGCRRNNRGDTQCSGASGRVHID